MATISANKSKWDGEFNWSRQGDEWSASSGGTAMLWYGTLLPRLHSHVPANCILEIGPGYGRWTQYLKDLCKRLIVIDLSKECIEACQRRFQGFEHIEYHINDGKSLSMIPPSSVDLVFSYDSLVHADEIAITSYIRELERILTAHGVAFIHHSNLREHLGIYGGIPKFPKLSSLLRRLGLESLSFLVDSEEPGWRDLSVDAKKVAQIAEQNGLSCRSQEIIPFSTRRDRAAIFMKVMMIDCISVITRANKSSVVATSIVVRNTNFNEEAANLARLARIYGA